MELERKFIGLQGAVKVTDGQKIEGYASLFGSSDQGGDVVEKGAYASSLSRARSTGRRIKMLWQHDPSEPIGIWDEVREDEQGLWVKGRILTEIARGREAAALIAAGAIDGLSIGYRTVKARSNKRGVRHLMELDLWEVSLVTFPMLPQARVAAKAEESGGENLRAMARIIEEARRQFHQGC